MSMILKVDSDHALKSLLEARLPLPLLGTLLRAVLDSFADAFTIFYARSQAGMGAAYEPFHSETTVNTLPLLIRSRLESRFPYVADLFREHGISWCSGRNTGGNHGHLELLIGDDFRIVVTKYNNGTQVISPNKKKVNMAETNGAEPLFPDEVAKIAMKKQDGRYTLFITYGYKSTMFDSHKFDPAHLTYVDVAMPVKDTHYRKMKQYEVSLFDYAQYIPSHNVSIADVTLVEFEDDVDMVTPNEDAIREFLSKRVNEK